MSQLSLFPFAETQARARAVPLPHHVPQRATAPADLFPVPDNWLRLLARIHYPDPVLVVSGLYTRQVLEAISEIDVQHMLLLDGRITQALPATWPARRRFLTVEEARDLHQRFGLVLIEHPLPQTVHFRLARPGEVVAPEIPLPPFPAGHVLDVPA